MGIFRHDLTRSQRIPETVREADDLFVNMGVRVPCDRCHVAEAQVEVVTNSGSVFLCRHHHRQYHDSIAAAGHLIRAWPGGLGGEPSSRSW